MKVIMMTLKEELLHIATSKDWCNLNKCFKENKSKKGLLAIEEANLEFSKSEQKLIWDFLYFGISDIFVHLFENEDIEGIFQGISKEITLSNLFTWVRICLNVLKSDDVPVPDNLFQIISLGHSVLLSLSDQLYKSVLSLCEFYILNFEEQKGNIIENTVTALLEESFKPDAQKQNVAQVLAIKEYVVALTLSKGTEDQLVSCVKLPVYIENDEGVRFIISLFSCSSLVPVLHKEIKNKLPYCTKKHSAVYANIYFRAWKNSYDEIKVVIEQDCLQDLMYHAVYVSPSRSSLLENLHHFMHFFHKQKKPQIESMLFALYEPFIWRSFKATNALIRVNACNILCDAFPLVHSNLQAEERGILYEKQYSILQKLLLDEYHFVRIAAIKGVCSIMSSYWMIIPHSVINNIFSIFTSQLIIDTSSADVRIQVVKGVTQLLSCQEAWPHLKEIVPEIADSFDDVNGNVRASCIQLLIKMKSTKFMSYWEIVPIQHLINRLEMDIPLVAKLIVHLLYNSFIPLNYTPEILFERCLALIEENRGAARRFYQFANYKLNLDTVVNFILLSWRCLKQYVVDRKSSASMDELCGSENLANDEENDILPKQVAKSSKNRKRSLQIPCSEQNKENEGENQENSTVVPFDNPSATAGLLDIIAILWTSNAKNFALSNNFKYLHALHTRTSKFLPLLFTFFKSNSEISSTLLYIASFMPESLLPTFAGHCISNLKSFKQDKDTKKSYSIYINALCNWNRADDILEVITEWIEAPLKEINQENAPCTKVRKSSRGVRFTETQPQPILGLEYLEHILSHPFNKLCALQKNRPQLTELTKLLSKVKICIEKRTSHTGALSEICSDEFLLKCWSLYLDLIIVLHEKTKFYDENDNEESASNTFNCIAHLKDLLSWIKCALYDDSNDDCRRPHIVDSQSMNNALLISFMWILRDVIAVGFLVADFINELCNFCIHLLKKGIDYELWLAVLSLSIESLKFYDAYDVKPLDLPQELFSFCIQYVSDELSIKCQTLDLNKCIEDLSKALLIISKTDIFECTVKKIVLQVLLSIETSLQQFDGEVSEIKFNSNILFIASLFASHSKLLIIFADIIAESTYSSDQNPLKICCSLSLLRLLCCDDRRKISVEKMKNIILSMEDTLLSIVNILESSECEEQSHIRMYADSARTIFLDIQRKMEIS